MEAAEILQWLRICFGHLLRRFNTSKAICRKSLAGSNLRRLTRFRPQWAAGGRAETDHLGGVRSTKADGEVWCSQPCTLAIPARQPILLGKEVLGCCLGCCWREFFLGNAEAMVMFALIGGRLEEVIWFDYMMYIKCIMRSSWYLECFFSDWGAFGVDMEIDFTFSVAQGRWGCHVPATLHFHDFRPILHGWKRPWRTLQRPWFEFKVTTWN